MDAIGANLKVLSRSSPFSPNPVTQPSSSSSSSSSASSTPLSSASLPFTPPSSNFNFPPPPPPPPHSIPPPPSPSPPLLSPSLLSSSIPARTFPASNPIPASTKVTILTSSASSLPPTSPGTSLSSLPLNVPTSDATYTVATSGGQGHGVLSGTETPVNTAASKGVVVVGVVGRSEEDVSQLLNRILDAQVFGSSCALSQEYPEVRDSKQLGTDSSVSDTHKLSRHMEWIKKQFKCHHDEDKGVVYVQFAWGSLPKQLLNQDPGTEGLHSLLEESEGLSLRGLLFMFSVCHIVLLVQESARVDTHLLRTLRLLQNAKHLLAPFVKTHVLPGLYPSSTAIGRGPVRPPSRSTGHSPGRSGPGGRTASTIGLMSGSAPSLFPGQCTPVLLFVFLEDFLDITASSVHAAAQNNDNSEPHTSGTSQTMGPLITSRQATQGKASNAVVMLARSTNRSEGGLRKKLHSSLEAQIRYLVKKCKVLAGSGDNISGTGSNMGPRLPGSSMGSVSGVVGGSALFVLDTMRVACLLDKGSNLIGEALEAALVVMNDILRGKEVAENALTELTSNLGEDVQVIRDFLWRQAEILRGRGGVLSNSTGGSMGVGMVAAAAAAAAASAAAGAFAGSGGQLKPLGNPPELPSISNWSSACQIMLEALVAGGGHLYGDASKLPVKAVQNSRSSRKGALQPADVSTQGKDALAMTLAMLQHGMGLEMKFSADWCKRTLPVAIAAYSKGLPACYPTVVHLTHLEKALSIFQSMVRGPAVALYTGKLKEECMAIWKSGRQLCDAISLTGKHCIHKVHDDVRKDQSETTDDSDAKTHSSGMVFLHACACGRTRKLRDDPFDYESANVTFFRFPNCEDLLPSLEIPDCEGNKPLGGSAWSLVRLGGAKYYQPSTGLLQSGFVHSKKFLSPWNIPYICDYQAQATSVREQQANELPKASHSLVRTMSFLDALEHGKMIASNETDIYSCVDGKSVTTDKKNKSLVKPQTNERKQVLLAGSTLQGDERRLFADVVARTIHDEDLAFPPLQQKQMHYFGQRNVWQDGLKEKKVSTQSVQPGPRILRKDGQMASFEGSEAVSEFKPRTTIPVAFGESSLSHSMSEKREDLGVEEAISYIGFEHECPRGHRFLLSLSQVDALGLPAGGDPLSAKLHKSKDLEANAKGPKHQESEVSNVHNGVPLEHSYLKKSTGTPGFNLEALHKTHFRVLNGGTGEGYTLLNMNLPLYMTCPHCSKTPEKKKKNAPTFGGNISQLQRVFMVTPKLPLLISTCPTVQFDKSCIPSAFQQPGVEFSLGCSVVLPPESFVVLRLPFVYFLEMDDGSRYPLKCKEFQPESSAWLLKGNTFKIISNDEGGINV